MAQSEDTGAHWKAINELIKFKVLPDKQQAWEDLHRLAQDNDNSVRQTAAFILGTNFSFIPNKNQAWDDLHRLIQDEDKSVRNNAAGSLGAVFSLVPDKNQAWCDLYHLTQDEDIAIKRGTIYTLSVAFRYIPEKKHAWKVLIKLTRDEDGVVRYGAAYVLSVAFYYIPEKEEAWKDLIELARDKRIDGRGLSYTLGTALTNFPDKKKAFENLHRLAKDENSFVRLRIAYALGIAFPYIPDKKYAWEDLHRLTQEEDDLVRVEATRALEIAFPYIPNKKQAWEDLNRLMRDSKNTVRQVAAGVLGTAFVYTLDEKQSEEVLYGLTRDEDNFVRHNAIHSLGIIFHCISDKKYAWENLHRFTQDDDYFIRQEAARALGTAFPHIPDKKQACQDLHRLAQDKNVYAREGVASALGAAFLYIPDKKQAEKDLHQLAHDERNEVRVSANHSLGKASILKATEAENKDDFRKELENALNFFEKSSREVFYSSRNPSNFCLPFYRSFYAIAFKKKEAETEVESSIAEAKRAIGGSESREKLLEAVENLSNALKEAQKEQNFDEMKSSLNAYRRYCEHACDLLDTTEEKAPGATKLIRKGLPIINERINEIIAEIQEKAKALCIQTKGTTLEGLGKEINSAGQNLPRAIDHIGLEKIVKNMQIALSAICAKMPNKEKEDACELLKKVNEEESIEGKLDLINMFLSKIPSQIGNTMTRIEIKDSSNVQIATGDGNIQRIGTSAEIQKDKEQTKKKYGFIKLITDPVTIASFAGFLSVEIGTYFYPISYNHIIGVIVAVCIFLIVIFFKR